MARNTASTFQNLTSASELGAFVSEERKRLLRDWRSLGGVGFMHAHSDLIDSAIARVFALAVSETQSVMGQISPGAQEKLCLVATGGYGRRELSPYSDVDVTFVATDEDDPQVDLLVKNAYRILMDAFLSGTDLKVGYAYRQLGECHDLPLDTHTALLDSRCLAGSTLLFERFHAEVCGSVVPALFVFGHVEARQVSTARFGASPYRVEPNIKEGAGGLRDLHTARWMAQVVFRATKDDAWKTLRARGIVNEVEIKALDGAVEFIARVRNCLHMICGRGTDALSVERQEEIAPMLGFRQGSPALMARYYAHAELLNRVVRKVTLACREHPLEIEPGIVAERDEIRLSDIGLFGRDPEAMIRVFQHAVTLDLKIGRGACDLLHSAIGTGNGRKRTQGVHRAFLRLLTGRNAHLALADMADAGVLQWLIPEFGRLVYQVPGDAAHELTVGAHSLQAVKLIGSTSSGEDSELFDVWSGIQEPELLFLATLLHDIGKVEGTGDHCVQGASIAREICLRLGLSTEAIETVVFLVRHHLVMGETSRLRDLNDQQAVQSFVDTVNSPDLLDMLYLLTSADLRSVGQANWSEVQLRFLRELYYRAATVLSRSGYMAVDVDRHRSRLARELSLANLPKEDVDEHCQAMPASYLLNTPPDDLAAHIAWAGRARMGKPTISMKDDPTAKLTEITICTLDDPEPGLLAKMAGAFYILNVDIHAAQVFTRETTDRIAIDTLYVDFDQHALPELKRLQVQSELEALLAGKLDLVALSERFGRKIDGRVTSARVEVISHLSDRHSILQIHADDQPGLLYRMTKAISRLRWNIHSARINTWGTRALDVFYVTDESGQKLDAVSAPETLRKALAEETAFEN